MLRENFSIKALNNKFYSFREEKYFHNGLHNEAYNEARTLDHLSQGS